MPCALAEYAFMRLTKREQLCLDYAFSAHTSKQYTIWTVGNIRDSPWMSRDVQFGDSLAAGYSNVKVGGFR